MLAGPVKLVLVAALMASAAAWRSTQAQESFEALASEVAEYTQGVGIRKKPLDELIALGERYVDAAKERHSEHSKEHANALNALAQFRFWGGQHTEANALFRTELAIRVDADLLRNSSMLAEKADEHLNRGSIFGALPYALGAADAASRSDGKSLEYAAALRRLASIHSGTMQYIESERLYRLSIEITQAAGEAAKPELMGRLFGLIGVLRGRHGAGITSEIDQLHLRVLDLWEELSRKGKLAGLELAAGDAFYNSLLYSYKEAILLFHELGRMKDYEIVLRRRITGTANAYGANDPALISAIASLANFLKAAGRLEEAEQNFREALSLAEHRGVVDQDWHDALQDFVPLLSTSNRAREGIEFYARALKQRQSSTERRIDLLLELAQLQRAIGQSRRAELSYVQALLLTRPVDGEYWQERRRATVWLGLGGLYSELGQLTRAHAFFIQSLNYGSEAALGSPADRLASLHAASGRWGMARHYLRKLRPPSRNARFESSLASFDRFLTGRDREPHHPGSLALSKEERLLNIIRASYHARSPAYDEEFASSFTLLQNDVLATQASLALQQMAARFAHGVGEEAPLVRARQDALAALKRRDHIHTGVFPYDEEDMRRIHDRRARVGAKLAELDAIMKERFPALQQLLAPEPTTVLEVHKLLRENEALIAIANLPQVQAAPEESLIWVITKTEMRWVRINLGAQALSQRVAALRCGLDEEEWSGNTRMAECAARVDRTDALGEDEPLPFHLGIAHELYKSLLGPVEELIRGKRLLIVPSGPLTSLPFHVLVTEKPDTALPGTFEGYRNVAWLGRSHAITVLPSVSSLKALREQSAKRPKAPADYIGIGNPILTGTAGECRASKVPERCPTVDVGGSSGPQLVVASSERATVRGGKGRRNGGKGLGEMYAKGIDTAVLIKQVRAMCPLPDTDYELRCVAERFPQDRRELFRDKLATEADLKRLNADGTLARYRIVHFATHGLIAGDVATMAERQGEPALVMTPPERPADTDDDGLLTASEVAQLRLNADWVVLSACSTAAGDGTNAEALSGLARAFFYAGTRALLVSHWPVYSDAAVQLTTQAFSELDRDPGIGRAEAFQRAMVALMEDPSLQSNAHPAVWAPFVVVGEGGAESDVRGALVER